MVFSSMFRATKLQVATYLLGIALCSIVFLVYINASLSFVVTEFLGKHDGGVGNIVGTLGFADELLAVIACPIWGTLSDRIGIHIVGAIGYGLIAIGLALVVNVHNVYPGLLLARLVFSSGAAAVVTMVSAGLPAVVLGAQGDSQDPWSGDEERSIDSESSTLLGREHRSQDEDKGISTNESPPARAAGLVGMLTGLGAILALVLLLPLPTRLRSVTSGAAQALEFSFYIVAALALLVSLFCFIGLRGLQYQGRRNSIMIPLRAAPLAAVTKLISNLRVALRMGFARWQLGLAYLAGFVARASSIAISLFIPLYVNHYFVQNGLCNIDDPGNVKSQCVEAYRLAAKLTGISQTVALVCAPVFGFTAGSLRPGNPAVMISAISGICGYALLLTADPRPAGFSENVQLYGGIAFIGINQIGAIVLSLALMTQGISGLETEAKTAGSQQSGNISPSSGSHQDDMSNRSQTSDLSSGDSLSLFKMKGAIAGVYSLAGAVGILLLTKLGGFLFDRLSPQSPFIMMTVYNAVFLVGTIGVCLKRGNTK